MNYLSTTTKDSDDDDDKWSDYLTVSSRKLLLSLDLF